MTPTDRDLRNAAARAVISARQKADYDRVYLLALGKFALGWLPSGRQYLIDKAVEDEARKTGARPTAAATCYSVRNSIGTKRHFIVKNDLVTEVSGYEQAFGPLLEERHPTLRIEVRAEKVALHHYNLCWAPIETYQPRSAEVLAKLRESRERKKTERSEKKWDDDHPLLAPIEREQGNSRTGRGD